MTATWHISVDPSVGAGSVYTSAIQALVLKPIAAQFESLGFTVQPMPLHSASALSVSHASDGAITLYLLKYGSDSIVIQPVILSTKTP